MCRHILKKSFCILIFLVISRQIYGQANLVLNYSFEDTIQCPTNVSEIEKSKFWFSVGYSPDYFYPCGLTYAAHVPLNSAGFQQPSHGIAYAGFFSYAPNGPPYTNEFIGGTLSQPLIIGQKYFVSLKFSLAELDSYSPHFIPSNNAGLKFTTHMSSANNSFLINNSAHIFSNAIISDTLNWTIVQGSFIADSNYTYIMIGNFFTSANTNTLPSTGLASYFFVDEVCVSTRSITCNKLNNLREDYLSENFNYYPNPTSDRLTISLKSEFNSLPIQLEIHDFSGRKIKQIPIETPNTTIDTSELNSGFYFLKLKQQNYSQITKTFIINRE